MCGFSFSFFPPNLTLCILFLFSSDRTVACWQVLHLENRSVLQNLLPWGTHGLPCHLSATCQELGLVPHWNSTEEPVPVEPWLHWYLQHLKEMSDSLQGLELRVLRSSVLCFFPRWLFPHYSEALLAHLTSSLRRHELFVTCLTFCLHPFKMGFHGWAGLWWVQPRSSLKSGTSSPYPAR